MVAWLGLCKYHEYILSSNLLRHRGLAVSGILRSRSRLLLQRSTDIISGTPEYIRVSIAYAPSNILPCNHTLNIFSSILKTRSSAKHVYSQSRSRLLIHSGSRVPGERQGWWVGRLPRPTRTLTGRNLDLCTFTSKQQPIKLYTVSLILNVKITQPFFNASSRFPLHRICATNETLLCP